VVPRVGSGSKDCLLRNRSTKSPASPSIESLGFYSGGGLASTDVVENQHDMECVAVVEAKAAIGPVG
jgi:hypothetical protein